MADDDKDEKKEVVPPPEDSPTPPPPPPPPSDDSDLRTAVNELRDMVTGLSEQVAAMAPLPGDETPTSMPWTHRGFK